MHAKCKRITLSGRDSTPTACRVVVFFGRHRPTCCVRVCACAQIILGAARHDKGLCTAQTAREGHTKQRRTARCSARVRACVFLCVCMCSTTGDSAVQPPSQAQSSECELRDVVACIVFISKQTGALSMPESINTQLATYTHTRTSTRACIIIISLDECARCALL